MDINKSIKRKIKETGLVGILFLSTLFSCAKTPAYEIIKTEDYKNQSKWKKEAGIKIYADIYTNVLGLMARITIEDNVNLPIEKMLESVDLNKDKYIIPEEFYKFKKDKGY
jgi:hypothetical protein